MGMTMSQKILAAHAGLKEVFPGQLIKAKVDLVMSSDATFPISVNEFKKFGFSSVFDSEKIALVMDHFTPCKDIDAAENCRKCRQFADEYKISNFFDVGQMGVEHALLPEKGLVAPGELIIGGDSHTCTYGALGTFSVGVGSTDICAAVVSGETWFKVPAAIKINLTGRLNKYVSGKDVILEILSKIGVSGALYKSMEYVGEGISSLSIDDRFTIANMAIECGAKNGIFEFDDIGKEYLQGKVDKSFKSYSADNDAQYETVINIDLNNIVPMVALPHLPSNAVAASEVKDIKVDEVFIGSCTNGRISDLAAAAEIFKGRKAAKGVRVLVVPATQKIYQEAIKKGYIDIFIDSGCAILTPNCAACGGGHMGLVGKDEVILSTSNRNFRGRMGHIDSKIYLSSPATAAASAVAGKIISPERIGKEAL